MRISRYIVDGRVFRIEVREREGLLDLEVREEGAGAAPVLAARGVRLVRRGPRLALAGGGLNLAGAAFMSPGGEGEAAVGGGRYLVRDARLAEEEGGHGPHPEGPGVTAPMPGRVAKLLAEPGQRVAAGTPLLVVESMKMETVVAAAAEGVVKAFRVRLGENINPGDTLVEIEPVE